MSNLMEQFMKDSTDAPTNSELSEISRLATWQLDLESEIKVYENMVNDKKETLKRVQEVLLPEAMLSVGMSEFKLDNGNKITIKDDVYASIRKEYLCEAVDWLDSKGIGDIAKSKVDVSFGRGESELVKGLMVYLQAKGFNATEQLSVHPQTLKATVKEQLARGVEFPEEFFSVHPVKKSVIKVK